MSNCSFSPLCHFHPESNGFCIRHQGFAGMPVAKKKTEPIKKVSDKRKTKNKELAKVVAELKKEKPVCEMKVPGICTGKTQTAHHTKGRTGKLLTDKKKMLACCIACNNWVESHHEEAVKMGLKVYRNTKV